MNEIVSQENRAAIYDATFRAYCATCSSDYAFRKGSEVGRERQVASLRTDEIARDAVEDVQAAQREFNKTLIAEADEKTAQYCYKFRDQDATERKDSSAKDVSIDVLKGIVSLSTVLMNVLRRIEVGDDENELQEFYQCVKETARRLHDCSNALRYATGSFETSEGEEKL